jgi:AcrR family transcriptional regulator
VNERPSRRGGRATSPQPGTRERILDAAMRRFIDQGYDGTSLREIADDLGFTKAALYYHFQTKDQILEALLEPMDVLIEGLFERLESATNLEEWAEALYWVIDQMHDNFDFFRLVQRNRTVLENVEREGGYMSHHEDMHVRFEATVQRLSPDVAERVRLVTAIAAVTGFDDWAPTIMMESDVTEIERNLKEVVRAILGLPKPRRR